MKMMRKMRLRLLAGEQGNTLVLTALVMVVLLGMTALVVDGGTLYVTKSHLQKTANAAVLSGAQELTVSEANVKSVVNKVLDEHQETGSLTSTDVKLGDKVTVKLEREVPLGFARLLGIPSAQVSVKAAAEIQTMGSAVGAAPLGIDESIPLVFNKEYKLKVDQTEVSNGYFGILALGGPGASTYSDNLRYGYKAELEVGDVIDTQTGNIAGKTRDGVEYRINNCPYPEGEYEHRDCARIILVPVYKPVNYSGGQLKHIEITGFAYFYITKPMDPKDTSITGMFIERAGTGIVKPGAVHKGAYAIRLTE